MERAVVGKAATEAQHGLGVDLAHSALRDAEDVTDLRQRQTLEVIEEDDTPLALPERAERATERAPHLLHFKNKKVICYKEKGYYTVLQGK